MPTPLHTYDYAIVRLVPRVDRGEFINAGVIVSCKTAGYLRARVQFDADRFAALAPGCDPQDLREALESIPAICEGGEAAGALRHLSSRERFDWLVAPRSSSLQVSPVHTGLCTDLAVTLDKLFDRMVRVAA